MRPLLALIALCLCSAACPVAPDHAPAHELALRGRLERSGGELRYTDAAGRQHALRPPESTGDALPYRLVSSAGPLLLTSIDGGLTPVTWALGHKGELPAQRHTNCLPLLADASRTVLMQLADDSLDLGGLRILGAAGELVAQYDEAELLEPEAGASGDLAVLALPGAENSAFYPFGKEPSIAAFDCAKGAERWRAQLKTSFSCADIRLVALTSQTALVMVQYDYETYEFFSISPDGDSRSTYRLTQQPAFVSTLPGGSFELASVDLSQDADRVTMALAGRGSLELDLNQGTGKVLPGAAAPADLREENPRPVGGAGVPGPGAPALPQGLLPEAAGDEWSIDALLRPDGAVLVLTADAAEWLTPEPR